MKKLSILATFVLVMSCGDSAARFFRCDDVCDKLVKECLDFLPMFSIYKLEDECTKLCNDEATKATIDCIEDHTCGEVFLTPVCWEE